jgi:hypothetical protein
MHGEAARITFGGYRDNDCVFDLRIRKGNEGDYFVAEDLNLCTFDEFHLFIKDGSVQFRAK